MSKFQAGQTLRLLSCAYGGDLEGCIGQTGKVISVDKGGATVDLPGKKGYYGWDNRWELVDENWHPHHDLIVAWAEGAKIQLYYDNRGWSDIPLPGWAVGSKYRIKPEKTARELEIEKIEAEMRKLADRLEKLR